MTITGTERSWRQHTTSATNRMRSSAVDRVCRSCTLLSWLCSGDAGEVERRGGDGDDLETRSCRVLSRSRVPVAQVSKLPLSESTVVHIGELKSNDCCDCCCLSSWSWRRMEPSVQDPARSRRKCSNSASLASRRCCCVRMQLECGSFFSSHCSRSCTNATHTTLGMPVKRNRRKKAQSTRLLFPDCSV